MKITNPVLICLLMAIACSIIGGYVGYLVHARRVVPDPAFDLIVHELKAREIASQRVIDSLQSVIDGREALQRITDRLHLAEIAKADSISKHYAHIQSLIPTADARGLRRITDSIMSGYHRDFRRYRALLDSARYGLLHPEGVP